MRSEANPLRSIDGNGFAQIAYHALSLEQEIREYAAGDLFISDTVDHALQIKAGSRRRHRRGLFGGLLLSRFRMEESINCTSKLFTVHRLGDIVVHTHRQCFFAIATHGVSSHGDD